MGNDFFDGLSETITRTAKEFGERAESLYEVQKLRSRISGEERLAEKARADLGNLVYQRYENGESVDGEIAALCEEITQHLEKIKELKQKAAGRRGQKICPSCHKAVDQEAAFCPYCGTPCPNSKRQEKETKSNEMEEEECGPQKSTCEESSHEEDTHEKSPFQDKAMEGDAVEEEAED